MLTLTIHGMTHRLFIIRFHFNVLMLQHKPNYPAAAYEPIPGNRTRHRASGRIVDKRRVPVARRSSMRRCLLHVRNPTSQSRIFRTRTARRQLSPFAW